MAWRLKRIRSWLSMHGMLHQRDERVFRSTRHPGDVREVLQADGQIKGLLPNYRLSVQKKANVLAFGPRAALAPCMFNARVVMHC